MVRELIRHAVTSAAREDTFDVSVPVHAEHGDYATNVALIAAKEEGKDPRDVASELQEKLSADSDLMNVVERIEIAGPGFLNFFLRDDHLLQNTLNTLEVGSEYGKTLLYSEHKMMFEYTDPNPFKLFHIGHLFPNVIGESLSRIAQFAGADVRRANYQGDVGMHVAKSVWGMQKLMAEESLQLDDLETQSLEERVAFLGKAYAHGAQAFEESEESQSEMKALNTHIFEKSDAQVDILYQKGRQWSLDYFETIYQRLGTHFDYYYFESEVAEEGKSLVLSHMDVFKEGEGGAIVFPGDEYGLHTRVFINAQGLPTYEGKELALAPRKYADFAYDTSVIVTANEINTYFEVLIKALTLISPELGKKTKHIGHGKLKLTTGKMSSRTGKVIPAEDLIDAVKEHVRELADKGQTDKEIEIVALAAIKYAFLKVTIGKDIAFDPKLSVELTGETGPYLQYTHARAKSVLEKSDKDPKDPVDVSVKITPVEHQILAQIARFPEIITDAAESYSPSTVCTYLYNLAQTFNSFYNEHQIVGSDTESFRVLLTAATAQVIKNGLWVLGIEAPEKM